MDFVLAPGSAEYKPKYYGDCVYGRGLPSGTVCLVIGPYIDAAKIASGR